MRPFFAACDALRAHARCAPTKTGGKNPAALHGIAFILLVLFLVFPAFLAAAPAASRGKNPLTGNLVKNPSYSGFNDAGRRTYLITGDQAAITNLDPLQIDIRGLRFMQYPGDGSATVQAAITAPAASVFFNENRKFPRITGRDSVRLVRENELDATGEDWSYDHARQNLTINKNARIIYNADFGFRISDLQTPATHDTPPAPANPQSEIHNPQSTITADTLELVQDEAGGATIAVLAGNVTVTTTDDLRLTCDHLAVTAIRLRDKDPALTPLDKFQHLTATGNVRITQGARTVTCGRAEVFPREDRVTLTQNPVVADARFGITAASDPMTLHRADRRIEGRNGHFTLPPMGIEDFGFRNADLQTPETHDTPPASSNPKSEIQNPKSEITATDYVIWETPDGLMHARLDNNVTVDATDTRLTSDHLEITATPEKQNDGPAAPAIPNPELSPLHRLAATGNVRLTQAGREITSGHAEMLPHEDKIILSQNPVLIDHDTAATATAGMFTLHRQARRLIAENNVSITLPPLDDLSATAAKPDGAPASAQPGGVKTTITGRMLTMWTTPDGISHAILDDDVRLAATNLDLTCEHLAVDADPDKPAAPAPQASRTSSAADAGNATAGTAATAALDPKLEGIASKILLMTATGNVRFRQLAREAGSGRVEIVPPEGRITLTENPVIMDRTNPADPVMITGEKMTLLRGHEDIVVEKPEITRAPRQSP